MRFSQKTRDGTFHFGDRLCLAGLPESDSSSPSSSNGGMKSDGLNTFDRQWQFAIAEAMIPARKSPR